MENLKEQHSYLHNSQDDSKPLLETGDKIQYTSSSYYVDEEKIGSAAGENFNSQFQKQMQMSVHGNKK